MHRRDAPSVPGHADETGQTLRAGFDRRLQSAAGSHRDLPFTGMRERMELEQIDRVHPKSVEGTPNLVMRGGVGALPSLRREEEVVAVRAHPRPYPELGVAVAGRGVDMVHFVLEQEIEGAVRFALAHVLERRCSEYRHRAHVPGTTESPLLDHSISPSLGRSLPVTAKVVDDRRSGPSARRAEMRHGGSHRAPVPLNPRPRARARPCAVAVPGSEPEAEPETG